ncbi:hypothetical protein G9H29_16315 [Klebsiella pneumoniae]|nr:hypothetical protein [Klebsiella pneumoniae]
MGSCAAPSAKGDDKFITTDYLQQCPFDSMKDESKKHVIINEFFDRGIWRLIWKNACTFRLRWRLGRRYLRIKRYRHAG